MLPLLALAAFAADPAYVRQQVSDQRMLADMEALTGVVPLPSGTRLTSRSVHHPNIAQAQAWLTEAFTAIDGLQVGEEPFAWSGPHPVANVIAELPGADPTLPPVIVMAHYDSTASLDDAWEPTIDHAPGADDDASGIAAILEIARVLTSWEPGFERSVQFIGFSAEEVGLVGSTEHVAARDRDVHLAIALDPVGHNPGDSDVLWFSYDARWVAEADALEDLASEVSELDVTGIDADLIGGDARSDHYPFWQAGLPALHVGTFPLPPSYHTREDTLDGVDLVFLTEVTVLIGSRIAAEARPLPEETTRACGCGHGTGPWSLGLLVGAPLLAHRRRTARQAAAPLRATPPTGATAQ